jgi:AcrR family transcriptional regulator
MNSKPHTRSPRTPVRKTTVPRTRARAASRLRGEVTEVFRRTILDAAEKAFATRGFVESKMAEIADRAGLGAATLYNYFENKETMFRALLELRGDEFASRFEAIAELPGTPLAILDRLLRAALEFTEEHSGIFTVFLQMGAPLELSIRKLGGTSAERTHVRIMAVFERVFAEAARAGTLRDDVAPRDLAIVLKGSLNGFVADWFMAGRPDRISDRVPLILDVFLRGAGGAETTTNPSRRKAHKKPQKTVDR